MLNFENDMNVLESEKAALMLLEKAFWIKLKLVSDEYKKYDLIVIEWNQYFPVWTTIDVKSNLFLKENDRFNNQDDTNIFFILEKVNVWWNYNIPDDEKWKSFIDDNVEIKSWWWAFEENMENTDYIFFLDKDFNKKEFQWNRYWYLVHKNSIINNNYEEEIKNGKHIVTWNYVSYRNNKKWRSAFNHVHINKFNQDERVKIKF